MLALGNGEGKPNTEKYGGKLPKELRRTHGCCAAAAAAADDDD
jgi:hypothetical protein